MFLLFAVKLTQWSLHKLFLILKFRTFSHRWSMSGHAEGVYKLIFYNYNKSNTLT